MKRFRIGAVASVLAATWFVMAVPGSANAEAGDPAVGMDVLDAMCREQGGQPYNTPYTIARCQAARSNKGFELEQTICEGLLDARFEVVDTFGRNNRSNWFCIPLHPFAA